MIHPDPRLLNTLLQDPHPCLRRMARTSVLGDDPTSPAFHPLHEEIRYCTRVQSLLSERAPDGTLPFNPYFKWRGAHWVLVQLSALGYPPGDETLIPLREQVLNWLLGEKHRKNIRLIAGLTRRCASQESNALLSLLRLGLADQRCDELARRLVSWQWPDGGWNCDKRPQATHSSFHESWIPMRALCAYANATGDPDSAAAAHRTAELFLNHRLFRRSSDGQPILPEFALLHYPPYWHYDLLAALGGLAELGLLSDPRCTNALDLLESYWLPGGGFPAHGRYYRLSRAHISGTSMVSWGIASPSKQNPWITCLALGILRQAARWHPS